MKTKKELDHIKEELRNLGKKLAELSEEELKEVAGGDALHDMPKKNPDEKYVMSLFPTPQNPNQYEIHFYSVSGDAEEKKGEWSSDRPLDTGTYKAGI